ncbi:Stress up-regulated Nod 19 [Abeliophyllum distichum]|uniref:Stress up-regulated Nod 19 n=1 Tax=Abeliophyllum distichum TaxID=126358 RepID=A0ABD1V9A4_9LAMI
MACTSDSWLYCLAILLLIAIVESAEQPHLSNENGVKTSVFLSPKFVLEPGSVSNKYYYDLDFPRGHIALKDFNAEVVDEAGNPIPLQETYLHHWIVLRYYQQKGVEIHGNAGFNQSDHVVIVRNSGVCDNDNPQYFGLGSETRRTATHIPDPYGIEIGNPVEIPHGYEEKWMLNVHAIDTRGVRDRLGCTECRCDLYNVTVDEYGRALPPDYDGGFRCCYDETKCRVKEGFYGVKRSLYLRYTVKYIDWDASIVPVKIYILDVTDIWTRSDESKGVRSQHYCLVEYEVESCDIGVANDGCTHTKSVRVSLPTSGDVIYGVAHQHTAGIGSTLYGQDGRVICSSNPIYGEGNEAGNEAGYIVGMSTCYPVPGSVKISDGEILTLVSNYSSARRHTGVMGLFYLLVADSSAKPDIALHAPAHVHVEMKIFIPGLGVVLFGTTIILVLIFAFQIRSREKRDYEAIWD